VLNLLASQAATALENAALEATLESLLKEVDHRVKNNLQLIGSLLNLQAARVRDPAVAELFADSRNRVRSMALAHENLSRAGDFARVSVAAHIRNLCAHLARAYDQQSQRVEISVQSGDVQLDLDRAVWCGLIINELVSNALKHAFPGNRTGRVRVGLERLEEKRCMLTVGDDGVGLPPDFDPCRADSLGLQLVHDITDQLHGVMTVSSKEGANFKIAFEADTLGGD
jgi:two-component sensor histidine kinase